MQRTVRAMRIPELHWSTLKKMAQSPAHLLAHVNEPQDATKSMDFGTLVHAIVLGGDFVVYKGRRSGKAWEAFEAEHKDRFIVTQAEHEKAKRAADSAMSHPIAAPLLLEGRKEWSWTAKMFGRMCGGRIDVAGHGTVELKTANYVEPGSFSRACLRMAYHAQLAWYQDARRALGENPGEAWIVGVESRAPYVVTVVRVTPRALEEGAKLNRLWLERLAACEAANEWPAYTQSVVDLDIVEEDAGLIIDGEEVAA